MEQRAHSHNKSPGWFERLINTLRVIAYIVLSLVSLAYYDGSNRIINTGNSQLSTITCSNGSTYTFASLGINASLYYYNPNFRQKFTYDDSALAARACGDYNYSINIKYDTSRQSNNPATDALSVFAIGFVIIEVAYRGLKYIFLGKFN